VCQLRIFFDRLLAGFKHSGFNSKTDNLKFLSVEINKVGCRPSPIVPIFFGFLMILKKKISEKNISTLVTKLMTDGLK
jgi:hypothetical protein